MSTLQFRFIAVLLWFAATLVAGLGAYGTSQYAAFRFGERVEATVVEVGSGSKPARLAYEGGRTVTLWEAGLKAGDAVALYVRGSGEARRVERVQFPLVELSLVGAAVFGLTAGGVFLWRRPLLAARRRVAWKDPLDVLIAAVARSRNVSLGGGVMFLLFAGFLGVLAWVADDGGDAKRVAVAGLAVVCVGLAALFLRHAYLLRDPRRNHVIELIERRPGEIAWFYEHRRGGDVRTSVAIHIWGTDRRCVALNMIEEELKLAMAELGRRAPHAPREFSAATQRQYRADPAHWRPAWASTSKSQCVRPN